MRCMLPAVLTTGLALAGGFVLCAGLELELPEVTCPSSCKDLFGKLEQGVQEVQVQLRGGMGRAYESIKVSLAYVTGIAREAQPNHMYFRYLTTSSNEVFGCTGQESRRFFPRFSCCFFQYVLRYLSSLKLDMHPHAPTYTEAEVHLPEGGHTLNP